MVWRPIYSLILRSKCWGTTAVVLLSLKYVKNFLIDFCLKRTYIKTVVFRVRLNGSWFGTRFWIFTTELFVIMNSFKITERNKNKWIYQWICDIQIIWKLSYFNLLSSLKDHYFWTLWTLNYVDCIPFSCIDSFHMAHNQAE